MILEVIPVGGIQVNCYVLAAREGGDAVIIDPGSQPRKIHAALKKHSLTARVVINTHGHYDHIGSDDDFGTEVYIHCADADMLTTPKRNLSVFFAAPFSVKARVRTLQDNDIIECDGIKLEALHIPGHTPGGVALRLLTPEEGMVFTGDTLFCRGVGRSDLEGGDAEALRQAIRKRLLTLPDATRVYPGHGPASTIGEEKRENPYL